MGFSPQELLQHPFVARAHTLPEHLPSMVRFRSLAAWLRGLVALALTLVALALTLVALGCALALVAFVLAILKCV